MNLCFSASWLTRRAARNAATAGMIAVAALTACESASKPPQPQATSDYTYKQGTPGGTHVQTLTVAATVTAIDAPARKLTLMGPDGGKFPITVGPEAVNFDQIRVGDQVEAVVTEELVVFMDDEGTASSDGAALLLASAEKGQKPAAIVAGTHQVVGTVTAIDHDTRKATLKFPDGTTRAFNVRSDIDLTQHKVGDRVVFQLTDMVAIRVRKP